MIEPIKENEGIGFAYTITEEQFRKHAQLSADEIFQWISDMTLFFHETQTKEEKMRKYIFKPNKLNCHHPTPEFQTELLAFEKQLNEQQHLQTPKLG